MCMYNIYVYDISLSFSVKLSCYTTVYCTSALSICTAQNCDYFSLLEGGSHYGFHGRGGGGSARKRFMSIHI